MTSPSSRMLELLSLLQVRREWAGEVLAERLEVSPRTVRRDVERLRDLGYSIEALRGPAGGYRLSSGAELPPLLFDDDQAVAVALALAVAPASGADIAEAATRALATIRQVMPSRLRHRVDAVEVLSSGGDVAVDPAVLVAVSEATAAREVLRFDYAPAWGAADDRPPLRVEPHAVIARDGRWYLLAWNPTARPASPADPSGGGSAGAAAGGGTLAPAGAAARDRGSDRAGAAAAGGAARVEGPTASASERAEPAGDWRTYRVDRIRPRTPTRLAFTPRPIPGGDPVAFVAARFRGADPASSTGSAAPSTAAAAWPCTGTAVLDLPPRSVAPYVDRDAVVEEREDGRTMVTMGSWSWRALAARFAGFDADLRIVGPEPLREAAAEVGRRLLAQADPESAHAIRRG
jgi:biotin operon repressor